MIRGATLIALLAPLALLAAGCPTGDGQGAVVGSLYIENCDGIDDYGSSGNLGGFDLGANFFVGEPITDPTAGELNNRLDLRIQRGGNNLDDVDLLYVQIKNVREAAKQIAAFEGVPVGLGENVQATLLLYKTCPNFFGSLQGTVHAGSRGCPPLDQATVQTLCDNLDWTSKPSQDATAVRAPFRPGDSCMIFCSFGFRPVEHAAAGRDASDIADDFRVDFGDTVQGIFFLTLADDRHVASGDEICADGWDNDQDGAVDETDCTPSSAFGFLQGQFNFEVRRGQVAQEFP